MSDHEEHVQYPPEKLGEYTVIQDIAEGTFGKVKSKVHPVNQLATFSDKSCCYPSFLSGFAYRHWPESCYEIYI